MINNVSTQLRGPGIAAKRRKTFQRRHGRYLIALICMA